MNDDTLKCAMDVIERLQAHVEKRTPIAVAVLSRDDRDPLVISDLSYWETTAGQVAFEQRAAELARKNNVTRGAFGTPMIMQETADDFYFSGPTNKPLPEGVEEQLWVFTFDLTEGYDLTRMLFTRRPDGTPVFDEPQTWQGSTTVGEATPGFVLLRTLLED